MAGGGAERAVATILSHLDPRRIEAYLCLFRKEGPFLEDVPDNVSIESAPVVHRLSPRLIFWLRRCLKEIRPDVTIAVLRYCSLVTTLAYVSAGRPGALIINEQNHPSQEMRLYGGFRYKRPILEWAYRQANRILVISEAIREDLVENFGAVNESLLVIPNPVDNDKIHQLTNSPPPHAWMEDQQLVLVAVGRLHPQKGYDLLLSAFAQLQTTFPYLRLVIVGEGAQRLALEQQAAELGIGDRVNLVGFQRNPYSYMRYATVFVLASRYEGFGIVLAEALTLGVPVVATDCPGGPHEILAAGRAGLLVPANNVAALADGLKKMLSSRSLRQKYQQAGYYQARHYAAKHIAGQYMTLFEELRKQ